MALEKATTEVDKERKEVLENFGKVCASRPLDMEKISEARDKVFAAGGNDLVVEASSIVGGFGLMTSVVDATGRKAIPNVGELPIMKLAMKKQ